MFSITSNSADRCLEALQRCHANHRDPAPNESVRGGTATDHRVSPDYIAHCLAHEAASTLTREEFLLLLAFLECPKGDWGQDRNLLHEMLEQRLESFYSEEVRISGENRNMLASPSGPEDADLGIILHIQSEDETAGAFWNGKNATISMLNWKGINDSFAFGYDWHWRGDKAFSGKPGCPSSKWRKGVRSFHDKLSTDILDMLPLPFVISASHCTRDNIRKYLTAEAKYIEIPLHPPAGVLRIDLDFRRNALRRIFFHIHHPSSGLFMSQDNRQQMAVQIDGGLNFVLWLLGRGYDADVFTREYAAYGRPHKKNAPLQEMWAYRNRETNEGRHLRLDEYSPGFLSWAGRHLRQEPHLLISRGESLASAVAEPIRKRMSDARLKHNATRSVAARRSNEAISEPSKQQLLLTSQSWNNRKASMAPNMDLKKDEESEMRNGISPWLVKGSELPTRPDAPSRTGPSNGLLQRPSRSPGNTERWKNTILRRQLLCGSLMRPNQSKAGARKVQFRYIAFCVPREANCDTVFIQCYLVPEGERHPSPCLSNDEPYSPAHRLGIKMEYRTVACNEEKSRFVHLTGKDIQRRLCSLVDFLEYKQFSRSEKQSQHFLSTAAPKGLRN